MHDTGRPDEAALIQLASSQAGLFTSAQAGSLGYSWALLSYHAHRGAFIRLRRGLYRLRYFPSAAHEEVMAAWLAVGQGAVISHESALGLHGLGDFIPATVHVTVSRARRHRAPVEGVTLHTAIDPPGRHEVVTREGMSLTSPARSILDVAESGGEPDGVRRAIAEALERGLTTPDQLRAGAARRGRRVASLVDAGIAAAVP